MDKIDIQSDMKIEVKGSGVKFYFWINQWYSTLDLIKTHVDQSKQTDNNYFYISNMDLDKKKNENIVVEAEEENKEKQTKRTYSKEAMKIDVGLKKVNSYSPFHDVEMTETKFMRSKIYAITLFNLFLFIREKRFNNSRSK